MAKQYTGKVGKQAKIEKVGTHLSSDAKSESLTSTVTDTVVKGAKKVVDGIKKSRAKKKEKQLTLGGYNTRIGKLLDNIEDPEAMAFIQGKLEETGLQFTKSGNLKTKQDLTEDQRRALEYWLPKRPKDFDYDEYLDEVHDNMEYKERHIEEMNRLAYADRVAKKAFRSFEDFFDYIYEDGQANDTLSNNNRREAILKGTMSRSDKTQLDDIISTIARGTANKSITASQINSLWEEAEQIIGVDRTGKPVVYEEES